MFFLLSKILNFLLVPFNWCIILLVVSFFVKKHRKLLQYSTLATFLLFSNTYIFQKILSAWEYPIESFDTEIESMKPIIVLGGLSSYDVKTNRIHFYEATDRLMQGLLLHKTNPERAIIISGGSAEIYFDERPEADYLSQYLLQVGVDSSKIHFETESRNTYENALNTSTLFDSININKNITLITSAFHMRRAKACFQKQGFTVHPVATHAYTNHQELKPADYFLPSLNTLQLWPIIIKEWMGILVYKLKGYL